MKSGTIRVAAKIQLGLRPTHLAIAPEGKFVYASLGSSQEVGVINTATGTTRLVEFTADRAGEFPFYCSVRCSPLHMALMGTLVVEP